MTAGSRVLAGKEQVEQIKVAEWLRQCTDLPFMHIGNERRCSPQQGALLKRMGIRAGVSDIFLPRGNGQFKGLWLELKTETGRPSPAQRTFLDDMRNEGYEGVFAYGANDAIALIREFYSI